MFATLKVQSFLTEVSDCGLLIVVTSSFFSLFFTYMYIETFARTIMAPPPKKAKTQKNILSSLDKRKDYTDIPCQETGHREWPMQTSLSICCSLCSYCILRRLSIVIQSCHFVTLISPFAILVLEFYLCRWT